jgi:hypothetical protein
LRQKLDRNRPLFVPPKTEPSTPARALRLGDPLSR